MKQEKMENTNKIKIANIYYNQGILMFETMPTVRFTTEASIYRKADELGYTHVCVRHGSFDKNMEKFNVKEGILPDTRIIPKKYRIRMR